jgi:hypothetical protein
MTRVQTAIAAVIVLVAAVVAVVVVVASSGLGSTTATSTPRPTPTGPQATPAATAATPAATPGQSGPVTGDACQLPASLPVPAVPAAAPTISTATAALAFTSYLYSSDGGRTVARDVEGGGAWAVGLWYVKEGTAEARLLAAPEQGMVLPLALAPAGDVIAAWWLPERRAPQDPACTSGIYLIPVDGSPSQLVASGDWSVNFEEATEVTWVDRTVGPGTPRAFLLPTASFSADGQFLQLHESDGITVHDRAGAQIGSREGSCPAVNWSATGASFAAGCDEFATAWLFDAGARSGRDLAIPVPPKKLVDPGWEWASAQGIAWPTADKLVTVRFYGIPTGCEVPGCTIPPPAYAVTTIDTTTGAGKSISDELDFLTDSARLSADGSWVYAQTWEEPAWVMQLPFGALAQLKRPGNIVGSAADGRLLFSTRVQADASVRIFAIDPAGATHPVATIAWPEGATTSNKVIWLGGLSAAVDALPVVQATVYGDFATP